MDWKEYMGLFDDILEKKNTEAPYDKEEYLHYVRMNSARINRWLKKNPIGRASVEKIEAIDTPQKWYLITEPWCGDAAHTTPVIQLLAEMNSNIELEIVLRDSNDMIDSYLTNGGRSIPKLVVRDENDEDLFSWGPRPAEAQDLVLGMKAKGRPYEEVNKVIQSWYNKDRASSTLNEINDLLAN